jgi:Asp-tRNA(Asn)/Glu-tRNA(Gln) amidotransferase A subunit family amidase
MTDAPWQGDACSLVEAFRRGERSPVEEMDATLAAVDASDLNAFSFLDPDAARTGARNADVSLPFGGVPFAIKELSNYQGWPATEACTLFRDRVATRTDTKLVRAVRDGGVVPFGLTTASEFGGLNVSVTKLNGVTHNPWQHGRTAGGSSGGSSAAVAGGLCTLASGGDGGGSIRIPAGFNGLPGMKGTAGRIPRGPQTWIHPMTVVSGVMARSIRDIARFYDVAAGYDPRDPYSLPKVDTWEADLGTYRDELRGKRVAIVPDLGVAVVHPDVAERVREAGAELARAAGLQVVDVDLRFPGLGIEWALGNLSGLLAELGDLWPDGRDELTPEIAFGLAMAEEMVNLSTTAKGEQARTRANETLAAAFDQADVIICATNPDVAFPAEVSLNTRVGDERVGPENNGALTIPYNIVGNPSLSLPVGLVDGLPVGMQVATLHHRDAWLLDLGLIWEAVRPWPLVAPGAPA